MEEIIRVENLSKKYGRNVVFEKLSFTIEKGRFVGLIGKNGLGKTTLLGIMGGFMKPNSGDVYYEGKHSSHKTQQIITLPEIDELYQDFTVQMLINYFSDLFSDFNRECAMKLREELHLNAKVKFRKLSKGMKERVCLLLTLSRKGKLYLFDEPFSGLDPNIKVEIKQIILKNLPDNATIIMSTHLLKEFELLFDQIMILNQDGVTIRDCDEIRGNHGKTIESFYLEETTIKQ